MINGAPLKEALGKRLAKELQTYFRSRNSEPNKLGAESPSGARRCEPNNYYFEGLVPSRYQGHHLLRKYLSFFLFLVA